MAALVQELSLQPVVYERVEHMTEGSSKELFFEARRWKAVVTAMQKTPLEKRTEDFMLDYLCVIEDMIISIGKNKDPVLFARDSTKKIQAIACYESRFLSTRKVNAVFVKFLIAAPWNVRWPQEFAFEESPLRGAGVLMMHAMFHEAKSHNAEVLTLSSCSTSMPFYEKIGMKKTVCNFFEFNTRSQEQEEKLDAAFTKAFGLNFHYASLT
jgi:hypothetical protein